MAKIVKVTMPELDLGSITLRASVWHAKAGQQLNYGDRLLEVCAGDVIVDIPSPADGILRKQLVAEDETLSAGQHIATIAIT